MQIKQITENNTNEWNQFIQDNSSPASFLQSWQWGQFRKKHLNEDVKYFGVYESNELIAMALFIKRALPGGRFYLNCPRGPIIKTQNTTSQIQEIFNLLIKEIKKTAKQEKIVFFRIAPPYHHLNTKALKHLNTFFIRPKILTHLKEPEKTLLLDLSKSEDEILKSMHQKTRYNIRLAEKKNIKIKTSKDFKIFYNLLKETAKRDEINIFGKSYYEDLINNFNKSQVTSYQLPVTLFIAEHGSTPLSAILLIAFGDTVTYFYGASSNEKRNLMPNYLIQWHAIKWAKKNDYKFYDFWGLDEKKWHGITKFKRGFTNYKTGQKINFIGTFDYVLNKKWYNLYRIGKLLKI